jgi:hypothetical protein
MGGVCVSHWVGTMQQKFASMCGTVEYYNAMFHTYQMLMLFLHLAGESKSQLMEHSQASLFMYT